MIFDGLRRFFSHSHLTAQLQRIQADISSVQSQLFALDELELRLLQSIEAIANRQNSTYAQQLEVRTIESNSLVSRIDALQAQIGLLQAMNLAEQVSTTQQMISHVANILGLAANEVNATLNVVLPQRDQFLELRSRFDALTAQMNVLAPTDLDQHYKHTQKMIGDLATMLSTVANEINGTTNLTTQHRVDLAAFGASLNGLAQQLSEEAARKAAMLGTVANEVNGTLNLVMQHRTDLTAFGSNLDGLAQRLSREAERKGSFDVLGVRSTAALIGRLQSGGPPRCGKLKVAPPGPIPGLEQQMAEFRNRAPNNFVHWQNAYLAGIAEGLKTFEGNYSHEGHIGANYFRMFVNVHARGRVLDIGCGPLPVPAYLADWPVEDLVFRH